MEWLALGLWVFMALVAIPLGHGAFSAPSLGLQPVLGIAGLVLAVLFAAGGAVGLAWAALALAVLGVVTVAAGAVQLVRDEAPSSRTVEHEATLAGVALPLYATVAAVTLLAALSATGSI